MWAVGVAMDTGGGMIMSGADMGVGQHSCALQLPHSRMHLAYCIASHGRTYANGMCGVTQVLQADAVGASVADCLPLENDHGFQVWSCFLRMPSPTLTTQFWADSVLSCFNCHPCLRQPPIPDAP